jgi:hypothetical protein
MVRCGCSVALLAVMGEYFVSRLVVRYGYVEASGKTDNPGGAEGRL